MEIIDIITLISTVVSGCHRLFYHVNTVNRLVSAAPLNPEGGIYPLAGLQRDQSTVSETVPPLERKESFSCSGTLQQSAL